MLTMVSQSRIWGARGRL